MTNPHNRLAYHKIFNRARWEPNSYIVSQNDGTLTVLKNYASIGCKDAVIETTKVINKILCIKN